MDLIQKFRYLGPTERRRLYRLCGLVAALLVMGVVGLLTRCGGGGGSEVRVEHMPVDEQKAITQVREAFFAVGTALGGEAPAPSIAEAVRAIAADNGAALTKSTVDGSPLRFNPSKADWTAGRGAGGVGTALVVAAAPPSYRARKVALIGIGSGGVPIEISEGSEPEWLAKAVVAPTP